MGMRQSVSKDTWIPGVVYGDETISHMSLLTDCLIPIYHTWYSSVLTDWFSHSPYITPGIHVSLLTDSLIPIYHTWYSRVLTDWFSHPHMPHLVFTCPYWLILSSPYITPGIHVSLLTDSLFLWQKWSILINLLKEVYHVNIYHIFILIWLQQLYAWYVHDITDIFPMFMDF